MWQKLVLLFKIPELRSKFLFVLAMLVVFRFAANIPIPGVDHARLLDFFQREQIFGLINFLSGSALENVSVVMLGVGPYITATIIMQLLTMIFPKLKEMYHESGEQGRQKFNQYSRILTFPLALLQAYGFLLVLSSQGIIPDLGWFGLAANMLIISAGSMFLMWIGELMSEKGIGNGISLIIFAGIVATIPQDLLQTYQTFEMSDLFSYLALAAVAVVVIAGVVTVTEAQRNIPVSYAKRIRGFRMFGGVSTHLPLRVNQAGVIPIIFALSILLFPGVIANLLGRTQIPVAADLAQQFSRLFQPGGIAYAIAYFLLVFVFTYFYTAVTFEPKAISENIQKQGGFIPGIRPGRSTAMFLQFVLNRITFVGALFLGLIAILPLIVQGATGIATLTIGGTALLIAVSVVLETMKQIEAQLVMRDYEGF